MESLQNALGRIIGFLPELISGLVVLAIGWGLAYLAARAIRPLLHRVGFDRLLARHGLVRNEASQGGSRAVAGAAYGVILVVALMQAARIWELEMLANGLARLIAYLPNVVAATVIFGVTYMFANWVSGRMEARATGREEALGARTGVRNLTASGVRAGILTLGAFLALRELRIGGEILTIAFACTFGAIAVAMALAFGLGSRQVAGRIAEDVYERGRTRRMEGRAATATGTTTEPEEELPPPIH